MFKETMLKEKITQLFDQTSKVTEQDIKLVHEVIELLDQGVLRVASLNPDSNDWIVNEWLKKAILLSFKVQSNKLIQGAPGESSYWFDKLDNKFSKWSEQDFIKAQLRTVPLSYVRYGAYIAPGAIVLPSFINIGAYVGEATMIDSFATVGSSAQIGNKCHISAGVCIGGVLEPLQANPVIIEDNCFIGASSQILEGIIIKQGSVIAAGSIISKSTKIIHRETGEIIYGEVPPYSVLVPGSMPSKNGININCMVIIKEVDAQTRSKTSINELLRN